MRKEGGWKISWNGGNKESLQRAEKGKNTLRACGRGFYRKGERVRKIRSEAEGVSGHFQKKENRKK